MTKEEYGRLQRPFAQIPNDILDAAPDYHVIMVWCAIWRHGHGSEQGCWASVERLAKVARVGRDRTRAAIKWLKENRWLIAEERSGYTTRYYCTMEGGLPKTDEIQPLASAQRTPLLGTSTPTGCQEGYPYWVPVGEQDPYQQDPNSLLSSGISDEIPTDAAANALAAPSAGRKRKAKAKGDEDFERFWRLYLSNQHRTTSQSKPKALAQWQKTIRTQSPDDLIKALETEMAHQQAAFDAGTFVANLPDCFRWLRDGRFETVYDRPTPPELINHDTYVF